MPHNPNLGRSATIFQRSVWGEYERWERLNSQRTAVNSPFSMGHWVLLWWRMTIAGDGAWLQDLTFFHLPRSRKMPAFFPVFHKRPRWSFSDRLVVILNTYIRMYYISIFIAKWGAITVCGSSATMMNACSRPPAEMR